MAHPTSGRRSRSVSASLLWPVSVFFTNSTLHMVAHASWAETAMVAGAAQLALVRGKLQSRWWTLTVSAVDGRQRRSRS